MLVCSIASAACGGSGTSARAPIPSERRAPTTWPSIDAFDSGPTIASIGRVPLHGVRGELESAYWDLVAEGLPSPARLELRDVQIDGESDPLRPESPWIRALVAYDERGRPWALRTVWEPVVAVGEAHDLAQACLRETVGIPVDCPLHEAWPILARDAANGLLVQRIVEDFLSGEPDLRRRETSEVWHAAEVAYVRGHDALALRWAELATRVGGPERGDYRLAFVEEAQRRVARGPREPPSDVLTALVEALEDTRSHTSELHGRRLWWPATDTVAPLVQQGVRALPALLACLEHDRRLTRAYRDEVEVWGPQAGRGRRRWTSVRELCLEAVRTILHLELPGDAAMSEEDRFALWVFYLRHHLATHPASPERPRKNPSFSGPNGSTGSGGEAPSARRESAAQKPSAHTAGAGLR
jgi:hypothetical protein